MMKMFLSIAWRFAAIAIGFVVALAALIGAVSGIEKLLSVFIGEKASAIVMLCVITSPLLLFFFCAACAWATNGDSSEDEGQP